jgi:hypothetical protein
LPSWHKSELEKIILRKLARLRRPKIICSPSYVNFRPKTNAVILLNIGHILRRERILEVQGKVGNPKLESDVPTVEEQIK